MPLSEKRTFSLDDPVFQKALALAEVFSNHCKEHDLPDTFVIVGVAHNSDAIKEQAYMDGKKYEQERIANILGLNLITKEEQS